VRGFLLRAALLLLPAAAQQLPQVQPTFRTGVDAVQLDVSVLDKDRRPVRGLTAADFTVLEGGQPRQLVAFSAIDAAPPATAAPSVAASIAPDVTRNDLPAGRLVVILMDPELRRPEARLLAQRSAERVVDGLGPGDLGAVTYTMFGRSQNLTADRVRLKAALDPSVMPTVPADDASAERGGCMCGLCKIEAVTRIAETFRGEPQRRKTVFYVGERFPGYPTGDSCDIYLEPAIKKMIQATQLANVTVHAVDPNGLEVTSVQASDNFPSEGASKAARLKEQMNRSGLIERQQSLLALTDVTGGRAIMNTNAPENSVRGILDESSSYYLLAFHGAGAASDGRFHPITVRVNRPDVQVRTRKGYYATPLAGADAATPVSLDVVTRGLLPARGLSMRITAAPFRGTDGKPIVVVATGVAGAVRPAGEVRLGGDAAQPTFEPIEILTSAFGGGKKDVEWGRQRLSVVIPERAPGELRYEAISTLQLDPGTYELRAAARHERTGEIGSVHAYLDVPDFSRNALTLSGVVLLDRNAPTATPPEALAGLLDAAPTTRREFRTADEVSALVRVYQRQRAPITVSFRVLDSGLAEVAAGASTLPPGQFTGAGSADARYPLPLGSLRPGAYVLRIEATRERATARRDVRFEVR
jgi:VWFA-related protein